MGSGLGKGAALLVGLLASLAWADPAPRLPELTQAQQQVDDGDFELAVKTLDRALGQPDLTDDQLAEAYRLLGLAHLYLGNEDKAKDAFEKLFQARPDYELPKGAPPKIRTLYARIKDDVRKRRVKPVTVHFEAPAHIRPGEPLTVAATIDDLALGAKSRLFYRRAGREAYSSVDLTRERGTKARFSALIPAFELQPEPSGYSLELYLEVTDSASRRLAGRGDAFNPLSAVVDPPPAELPPPSEPKTVWYKNPWVWVGVGVVAAAAVTTGVVLATQNQTGTLPITIRIDGQP